MGRHWANQRWANQRWANHNWAKRHSARRLVGLEHLESRQQLAGDVVIAEFMAVNSSTLADEDGDFSDWVELRNVGSQTVNLNGWHLTDDPAVPSKWTFGSRSLEPNDHLIVFASGKNRQSAELHTNFSLPPVGGYIGLFEPSGNIESNSFASYPQQVADYSFGVAPQAVETDLVPVGAAANLIVPSGPAELPPNWKDKDYDDAAWAALPSGLSGATGFGYESAANPGSYADVVLAHEPVRYFRFEETNTDGPAIDSASAANGTYGGNVSLSPTSAFDALGRAAVFDGSAETFVELSVFHPGDTVTVEAWVNLANQGPSGFAAIVARWDGSYELDVNIGSNRANFVTRNTANTFALAESADSFTRDEWHHVVGIFENGLTTIYVDGTPGTVVDTSATGTALRDAGARLLIGATRNGDFRWTGSIDEVAIYDRALTIDEIRQHINVARGGAGLSIRDEIETDIEAIMFNQNATSAIRIPFEVGDPTALDSLTFLIQYDDGFVAYLNGNEVARDNVPMGTPSWNSTAVGSRSNFAAVAFAEFNLTSFIGQLMAGTNTLAIHGLNAAADDVDFLLTPRLISFQASVADPNLPGQYLDVPTPNTINSAGSAGVSDVANVQINEIVARGSDLADEDGDTPDWIELYNPHRYAIDLHGAYLTDSKSDLTRWQFPRDSIVPPRGYRVVYASDKDREIGELHTNFRLNGDGEYVALVQRDGETIVAELANVPTQFSGVSYGTASQVASVTLIDANSTASILVPKQATDIPNDWRLPQFDDSAWSDAANGTSGTLPVGYGLPAIPGPGPDPISVDPDLVFSAELSLVETAHRLQYESAPNGGTPATNGLTNLALATNGSTAFATSSLSPNSFGADRLNDGGYGQGNVGDDANPWIASSSDNNGFVGIAFPTPQSLNMMAFGTRLAGRGDGLFSLQYTTDSFTGIDLADSAQVDNLTWNDLGTIDSSETDEFERQLFGFLMVANVTGIRIGFEEAGTAISEIEAYHLPVDSVIATDLQPIMDGLASTAMIRIPFTAANPAGVNRLALDMQFNDGFVAFLNGAEVARRNVDGDVTFDSVATEAHSPTVVENIDISQHVGLLQPGVNANVLAIHALNASAGDGDFVISPRLEATSLSSLTEIKRYFLTPSPGSPNGLDDMDRGPVISDATHVPNQPLTNEDLVVTARVTAAGTDVNSVQLHYRVMYGVEAVTEMNDDGISPDMTAADGVFTGSIPASAYDPGEMVRYYVTSIDVNANAARWPLSYDDEGQDRAPEYFGTVVIDPSVTSELPRLHWFSPTNLPVTDGNTGWSARASLYFEGEFYDNVSVRVRGASSAQEEKKPFKFDFADGQYFRYSDDAPRAEEINLNATFQDKAYLREPLSYEIIRRTGTPAPDSQNVRVDVNGEFFSVANMTQQIDEIFLADNGLDPTGALYKMFNGITSSSGGVEKKTRFDENNADLSALVTGLSPANPNRKQYVFDNIDLPAAINYMTSGILVQDFDRGAKNFYVYRDTNGSGEWTQIPWDEDLTLGNRFYSDEIAGDGSGGHGVRSHPFWGESEHNLFGTNMMIDAIVDIPETREMYLRRLRTLMDEILQTTSTPLQDRYLENRIDELATILADDAALDLERWGAIYGIVRDFDTAIGLLKTNYVDQRRVHLFETHNIQNLGGGTDIISTLIPEFVNGAQYFVPTDDSLGLSWTEITAPANSDAWQAGQTGIGYEDAPADYADLLNSVADPPATCPECTSVFVRIPFEIPDQTTLDRIVSNGVTLRMKYDDGFIAYVNGNEVTRRGVDGQANYDTTATNHDDGLAVVFEDINISTFTDQLVVGTNVLAIHALNQATTSSDMLILPVLVEGVLVSQSDDIAGIPNAQVVSPPIEFHGSDFDANPVSGNQDQEYLRLNNLADTAVDISGWRLDDGVRFTFKPGTVIPAGGSVYVSPNVVDFRNRTAGPSGNQSLFVQGGYSGHLSSRGETVNLYSNTNTLIDSLEIPAAPSDAQKYLRISEMNYNPAGSDDGEFIELFNISGDTTIDLSGVMLTDGPSEPFVIATGRTLGPGEYALIVRDAVAFAATYPLVNGALILGEYEGGLSNGGERIRLDDANGSTIVDFTYDDSGLWPQAADGVGSSLELIDSPAVLVPQIDKYYSWRSSTEFGGTPGAAGAGPIGVVINEVLANTDPSLGQSDAIELYNTTADAIDLTGWYLSDAASDLKKFAIPSGTILEPGGYVVFDESDFNPTPLTPAEYHFALSGSEGDDVWLVQSNLAGEVAALVDDVHFRASFNGQTLGRTANSNGLLTPNTRNTLGCRNSHPLVSDVTISAIMFDPGPPSAAAAAIEPNLDNNDLEYIVIQGPSVSLDGWRIRGGVDFDIPLSATTDTSVWILSFDPELPENANKVSAFVAHYGLPDAGGPSLFGGFAGSLNNSGEQLRLERPDTPPINNPSLTPYVTVDEVIYDNFDPWPVDESRAGDAIIRRAPVFFGNDGAMWRYSSAPFDTVQGDFDGDNLITPDDIDLLFAAAQRGSLADYYVISGVRPAVDLLEVQFFVEDFLDSAFGDANLDGVVDGVDFGIWRTDSFQSCTGWGTGDFNGDGATDASDFNTWNDNRFQAAAAVRPHRNRTPRPAAQQQLRESLPTPGDPTRAPFLQSSDPSISVEPRHPQRARILSQGRRMLARRNWMNGPDSIEKSARRIDDFFADFKDI